MHSVSQTQGDLSIFGASVVGQPIVMYAMRVTYYNFIRINYYFQILDWYGNVSYQSY